MSSCSEYRQMSLYTPTSTFERGLLAVTIVSLPAEDHFRIIPGFSTAFILFGVIAAYVMFSRFSEFLSILGNPTALSALLFLVLCVLIEVTHDNADYVGLIRTAQMVIGALLIASICRDVPALRIACYGYLGAGLWLSTLLVLSSYGALSAATTKDFHEASLLRDMAFDDNPLQANLNNMAFGAAQGAVVALVLCLFAQSTRARGVFSTAGFICMLGAFLPLSRGGVLIAIVSCASVLYAFGLRHGKTLLIAVLLGGAVMAAVPQAVWSRMDFSFEEREGKIEGRAYVYKAAIDHLSDYIVTGVGAGNFWSTWGRRSAFAKHGDVAGAHNCILQVALYWGIIGLAALLLVFWQAYRSVPRNCHREAASLCLLGIGVSLLLFSMVIHNIYAKEFSIGLGLLIGAHHWIWPGGVVHLPSRWSSVGLSHAGH